MKKPQLASYDAIPDDQLSEIFKEAWAVIPASRRREHMVAIIYYHEKLKYEASKK